MKKIYARRLLLFCVLLLSFLYGRSQIIVFVQEPPALVGNYDFTWADPGGGWGTPDLNDPANSVVDTLAFVDDGTVGDSLGCNTLVNGPAIVGKIAVVYRGTCEFGVKALNAETEGAVAVIIVNNSPGAPVGMGSGAQGANVTIPVVMISQDAGALLKSEIDAGNVIAFIGSIAGNFPNNLSIYKRDVLIPAQTALPKLVAADASEFDVSPGTWVHNYGTNDQTGVVVNADISLVGGSSLYNESSAGADIFAGDSAFITLPDFSQSSYDGRYRLTYTVSSGVVDDFPNDDAFVMDFLIDSLFSYGSLDPATDLPIQADFYQPSGLAGTFQSCVAFMDPNGSRLGVTGMYGAISASAVDSVTGELLEEFYAYEWNDVFTGVSDPNATVADIVEIGFGEFTYEDNTLEGDRIFIPFEDAFALEDDQRYLFCLSTSSIDIFQGFDNKLHYNQIMTLNDQPTTVIDNAGTWFIEGFGRDIPSAIGVRMISDDHIGMEESALPGEVMVYPNPSVDMVRIPLPGVTGDAQLDIIDLDGRVIATQRVVVNADHELVADVTSVANGTYLFKLVLDDGGTSTFRVVVSR